MDWGTEQVVLVTGGAGYIGAPTAKALKEPGHGSVVYDNLSCAFREAVRAGPLAHGDVRDAAKWAARSAAPASSGISTWAAPPGCWPRCASAAVGRRPPGDPASLMADPGLARAVLGWRARRPSLDQIVGDALRREWAPAYGAGARAALPAASLAEAAE